MNQKSTMTFRTFARRFMPTEVYPLIVPLCCVCSLGTYMGIRTLVGAPDIHVTGTKPRYETGEHRYEPHFAGIHTKASRFDPHPEMGEQERAFHATYARRA